MIPAICLLLFSLIGTWMMIDPLPGYIILNFPEFVGRIVMFLWFTVVRSRYVFDFHMWMMPVKSILFYSYLLEEMETMARVPLGMGPETYDPSEWEDDE